MRIPSRGSRATARSLMQLLYTMERGQLIDKFTSIELKRLLYFTQRRTRYAASEALESAAVYTKSGSLFRCKPQAGYTCKKYEGNLLNQLCSISIIEYPALQPQLRYIVVLSSNVLRKNSEVLHRQLATQIHNMLRSRRSL